MLQGVTIRSENETKYTIDQLCTSIVFHLTLMYKITSGTSFLSVQILHPLDILYALVSAYEGQLPDVVQS